MSDLFLNSTTRIGRVWFTVGAVALAALWGLFDHLVQARVPGVVTWIVAGGLLFSGACVLSRRLHDIGRSGWWCWPILLAFALAWPVPDDIVGWVAAVVLAVAALVLLLVPGDRALNRHGPPPA